MLLLVNLQQRHVIIIIIKTLAQPANVVVNMLVTADIRRTRNVNTAHVTPPGTAHIIIIIIINSVRVQLVVVVVVLIDCRIDRATVIAFITVTTDFRTRRTVITAPAAAAAASPAATVSTERPCYRRRWCASSRHLPWTWLRQCTIS